VNPLYIGTAERRIFGIHDPAAPTGGRPRAAVLCYPWGTEYIYAHRSMRHLALKLAASGYHTLRFDYFGTGDSDGEAADVDPAGCASDTESAIEAVKDIAGAAKVALIGLRAGAHIAASVAARSPADVEALVLWDPLVAGAPVDPVEEPTSRASGDLRASAAQVFGTLPSRSLILVTQRLAVDEERVRGEWERGVGALPVEFVPSPCPWVEAVTNSGALPVPVIRRIDEWLR